VGQVPFIVTQTFTREIIKFFTYQSRTNSNFGINKKILVNLVIKMPYNIKIPGKNDLLEAFGKDFVEKSVKNKSKMITFMKKLIRTFTLFIS
jgi:hypothetical protein